MAVQEELQKSYWLYFDYDYWWNERNFTFI